MACPAAVPAGLRGVPSPGMTGVRKPVRSATEPTTAAGRCRLPPRAGGRSVPAPPASSSACAAEGGRRRAPPRTDGRRAFCRRSASARRSPRRSGNHGRLQRSQQHGGHLLPAVLPQHRTEAIGDVSGKCRQPARNRRIRHLSDPVRATAGVGPSGTGGEALRISVSTAAATSHGCPRRASHTPTTRRNASAPALRGGATDPRPPGAYAHPGALDGKRRRSA